MTHLEAFYDRVAAHAKELPREGAAAWLVRHGLFARAIRDRLPEPLAAEMASEARRNLAKNLHWIDAFTRLAAALGAEPDPIPVCPLKGIALLGTVYAQDLEARALTDLDVLVPESRVNEAVARLGERMGLRETAASAAAGPTHHERTLEGDLLAVDVHGRLGVGWGAATRYEGLETVSAEVHGQPVRRLSDADTLAYLLGHLVRHGPFARLAWAEDALRVAGDGDGGVEVGALVASASRLGARRVALAGVVALRWLAGEGLFAGVERSLPDADRRRVATCVRLLWRRQRREPLGSPAPGPLRRFLCAALLADAGAARRSLVGSKVRRRAAGLRRRGAR